MSKCVKCPECNGKKAVWYDMVNRFGQSEEPSLLACRTCHAIGTIPDRRAADERDAAFERASEAWGKLSPLVSIMSAFDIEQANRLDAYFNPAKEG